MFLKTQYVIHTVYCVVLILVPERFQPMEVCSGEALCVEADPYKTCGFFTLKYQLIAHYFNTLCKTHAKIRRSNPLNFISLLHVSILKDHHQGVNVTIYEVIECFLFLLILNVPIYEVIECFLFLLILNRNIYSLMMMIIIIRV